MRPPGALALPVLPTPVGPEPTPDTELALWIDGVTRVPGYSWLMRDVRQAVAEVGRLFDASETLVVAPRDDPANWVYEVALDALGLRYEEP